MQGLAQAGFGVRIAARGAVAVTPHETVTVGSIDSKTEWNSALAGVDAVVHLAGRAHQSRSFESSERQAYFETNTAGTLRLAQAAAGEVRHFVFLSTILVNGSKTDGQAPFTENDTPAPSTIYAESKARAEEGLSQIAVATGLIATVLRPPLIYGRRAKGNFALPRCPRRHSASARRGRQSSRLRGGRERVELHTLRPGRA